MNTSRGEFGDELADAKAGTMDEIYADLDNATPCIFILSKGSDPTGMLFKLAKQNSDALLLVTDCRGPSPSLGPRAGTGGCCQKCARRQRHQDRRLGP